MPVTNRHTDPMQTVDPDPATFLSVIDGVPRRVPVVMLNLLRFRDVAEYQDDAQPTCSGRDAYLERYGPAAFEQVRAVGGELVWAGSAKGSLIAPAGEVWDEVLLVRYPSIEAFVAMTSEPAYVECARHRTAALTDSRLIVTVEGS